MKKHIYRATSVNSVDWARLVEEVQAQRVVVAIDVAKEVPMAALMTAEGQVLKTLKWAHPAQSAEVVAELLSRFGHERLEVVMEPSGTYGDALRYRFEQAGVAVYRVSPKRSHDAQEVYDGVPSLHDAKSASLIGRLHLAGASRRWEALSAPRRELLADLALLELYQDSHQRHLNRLEALLSRHWPEVTGWLALDSVTLTGLLVRYGDPAGVAAQAVEAARWMRRWGRAGLSEEKIEQVLQSARTTLGVPCLRHEEQLLRVLGQELEHTREALHQAERQVQAWVEADACARRLAAVVGRVTAAVLMAKQGSPLSYPSAASYLKGLGLNLKEKSSGKHRGQLKLTKRGPALSRKYLYWAALRLLAQDPRAQAWYRRKMERNGHAGPRVVVALMRKLAKALWHVAQGQAFDSSKLFNPAELQSAA